MFGKRFTQPVALVAHDVQEDGGKFDLGGTPWDIDATGHALLSQSLSSYALEFFIDNSAGVGDVALVDGRLEIVLAAGPTQNLPEWYGNVVLAGQARWVGPFSAMNGPFHVVRVSTHGADVPVRGRYAVEMDQKAT